MAKKRDLDPKTKQGLDNLAKILSERWRKRSETDRKRSEELIKNMRERWQMWECSVL